MKPGDALKLVDPLPAFLGDLQNYVAWLVDKDERMIDAPNWIRLAASLEAEAARIRAIIGPEAPQ